MVRSFLFAITLAAGMPAAAQPLAPGRPADAPSVAAQRAAALKRYANAVPGFSRREQVIEWHGRRYKIFLSVPVGPPPATGFPALYVTDANGTFPIAAQTAENDAAFAAFTGVQPSVVVGIGYDTPLAFPPMRAFDLSPPDPNPPANAEAMAHEAIVGTGGADELLDMIEQVVKPLVARQTRVDPARQALFGHSRGGLFVLHALFTRPAMFNRYIAASPAIWWHDRFVLGELPAFSARIARGEVGAKLLITTGALEGKDEKTPPDPKDANMVGNARALARELSALNSPRLAVRYREFAEEDHMSVIPGALAAAVRFALGQPR